jgi:tetratricopeptide (TPR) repeat protein
MHYQVSIATAVAAFERGDLDRARQLAEEQFAKGAQVPMLHHLMGLIECRAGRMEAGVQWLQRAARADPDNVGFQVILVRALVDSDRAAEALALVPPPRGRTPAELGLWQARAEAAHKAGDAEASFQAWLVIASTVRSDWRAWCETAEAAARLERWADAADALERAAALNPHDAAIPRNLGAALSNIGRSEEAIAALRRAAALEPDYVHGRLIYAQALIDAGRKREAAIEAEEAARVSLRRMLANGEQPAAGGAKSSGKPINISPDRVAEVRELGYLLDRLNHVDDLRELLAAAQNAGIAPETLSSLWASVPYREGRLKEAQHLLLRGRAHFRDEHWDRLMTKAADALGDSDQAFAAAEAMNRSVPHYDGWKQRAAAYRANIRLTADVVTLDWVSRMQPLTPDDALPNVAFVVGFPRSGTTLLETFLLGHPQTQVVEEGRMLEEATRVVSEARDLDWPLDVLMHARKTYVDELCRNVPADFGGLVIDRHPLNMLRLPVIHALFPRAKVIFTQRHPCDVVLSAYMQSFRLNPAMASFLDLADAADFYDAAMTMWTRSRDAIPQEIHSVVYERLTADPAAELKPAVAFLGLDWRDGLLDHQTTAKTRGLITTASYDQVVQPLSRAPAGRWRRYRKQLEPVLPILLPWADRLGYALD